MSARRRVLVPCGTRPEIIKLAPVVRALRAAGHAVTTVDTGQHASAELGAARYAELGLPVDIALTLPAHDQAARLGALTAGAVATVARVRPDLVLALGDTATVPAYALAARGLGVPFGHLEAGLRSFNQRSVEEVNRRVAAATAQVHFAPTRQAAAFLAAEGVEDERVFVVGNPVIDALRERGAAPVPPARRTGVLVTAHRPTNVDDPVRLARLARLVEALAAQVGPVTFPVHPRTADRLRAAGLEARLAAAPDVTLAAPLAYDGMLAALAAARVVVTDSGGVQEEAAYLGVPVVVLRRSTPRWEGVTAGSAVLSGLTTDDEADRALAAARALQTPGSLARLAARECPYGDGTTGAQVAEILGRPELDRLLDLVEPDFTDGVLPGRLPA
ncbi:UDP-N-acetylglucosamine 2-epimerase (non-hydrolyzing) [Pilimelia terevasa]|uniref:UDP-N-acetylglucosamine 2-epimerase (Non-hydrolyzing) n=1 Tax=Pilimelia terevasa TaxID=53372 RepID=A0A8J3BJT1_9ACTN|nr:UDP-N-acetylglucosamine 2-epimerase (non-hydrolyzing) [Pilimelia terevasa]GGK24620.1 UDP-N-acetylglucosamine 2-epimerase (non-hydrolyzing) [Pilimelia terevasa]